VAGGFVVAGRGWRRGWLETARWSPEGWRRGWLWEAGALRGWLEAWVAGGLGGWRLCGGWRGRGWLESVAGSVGVGGWWLAGLLWPGWWEGGLEACGGLWLLEGLGVGAAQGVVAGGDEGWLGGG
jgi:hypothetical protein